MPGAQAEEYFESEDCGFLPSDYYQHHAGCSGVDEHTRTG